MKVRTLLYTALALAPFPLLAQSQPQADIPSFEARLRALEKRQSELEEVIKVRDQRIEQLEFERDKAAANNQTVEKPALAQSTTTEVPAEPSLSDNEVKSVQNAGQVTSVDENLPATSQSSFGTPAAPAHWGTYEGPNGFVLVRSDLGELDMSVTAYARYLNQQGLDNSYTDAFGRTKNIDTRNDFQFAKMTMNFKGWIFDPDFRYLFFAWTANANQGLGAQVTLGGYLSYRFNEHLTVAGGIGALPSTRSTNWTYPNWLRNDNRTMADEYFRGSFTSGIWAWGNISENLRYRVMLGNNLSQLGVDSSQLDSGMNTVSAALWWMPTTGEFGPAEGFGDYEMHEKPATLFGVHFTHSREDAQSQPGMNNFENSQIRISDGTLLFSSDPFATGGSLQKATYQMVDLNAGVKYRGFSLEGEYYWRTLDDFRVNGMVPVDSVKDHGFQLQGAMVLVPNYTQIYLTGSKIYGDYGDPWDAALGVNWFPFGRKQVRVNAQALYMDHSAVGNGTLPFQVGGTGWAFTADVILAF